MTSMPDPKPRRCSTRWAPSLPSSSATRPGCSRRYRSVHDRARRRATWTRDALNWLLTSFAVFQSTVREPAVRGMRRALLLQYTAGAAGYYGISVAGYWAYGSAVSEYLPNELGGPRWAAVLINATAFLQSIVSQHVRTRAHAM